MHTRVRIFLKHSAGVALALAALAAAPAIVSAQKPTTRRQAPIEIRGQVPTPQVVTVRPRAVPAYSRQILVPRFFNHDFWPEIEQGYQFIPQRQLTGGTHLDSALTSDSTAVMNAPRPPAGTASARHPHAQHP